MPGTHLPRRTALLVAALALGIRAVAGTPQLPTTTPDPLGPRTGLIVGQVVDAGEAPVPEAIVQLTMPGAPESSPTTPRGRVMADRQGRYFFSDLPAGEYVLQATKDGYTGGLYQQRRPGGAAQRIRLAAGERLADVMLTLWKFGAITGTVLDEAGEPVIGVGVRALARTIVGGRLGFGNPDVPLDRVPMAVTDDRGLFRLSRLLPGSYVVFVPSTLTTMPVAILDAAVDDRRFGNSLSSSGIMDLEGRGQPRALQVGDVALVNLTRGLTPPPMAASGMLAYRATYFPSAATAAEATLVIVVSGEEREAVTIAMRPTRAVRVSGRLVAPDGSAPPAMPVRLVGSAAAGVVDFDLYSGPTPPIALYDTAVGMSDASGRFTLLGVPPGSYTFKHGQRILYPMAAEGRAYWAAQSISVGESDIDDLVIELKPGYRISGRVEVSGGDPASLPQFLAAGAVNFDTAFGEPGRFGSEMRQANGPRTFGTAAAAGGRYVVSPVESSGWFVHSVTIDGRDITDRPFDLQSDVTTLVVTYTNRPSRITGTVKDIRGTVSPTAMVIAFPVDEARWTAYGSGARRVRSTAPNEVGAFTFEHLPPDDYFVVALEDEDPHGWRHPDRLKVLSTQAARITVTAGSPRTVDLTSLGARR